MQSPANIFRVINVSLLEFVGDSFRPAGDKSDRSRPPRFVRLLRSVCCSFFPLLVLDSSYLTYREKSKPPSPGPHPKVSVHIHEKKEGRAERPGGTPFALEACFRGALIEFRTAAGSAGHGQTI